MLSSILQESGLKAKAVGNIGLPILDFKNVDTLDVLIIELSSFQLEILNKAKIGNNCIINSKALISLRYPNNSLVPF